MPLDRSRVLLRALMTLMTTSGTWALRNLLRRYNVTMAIPATRARDRSSEIASEWPAENRSGRSWRRCSFPCYHSCCQPLALIEYPMGISTPTC